MDSDDDTQSIHSLDSEISILHENIDSAVKRSELRITSPRMTKFEKAYILGVRASQLSMNAPPLVDIGDLTSAYEIATKELTEKKIPFILRRKLPCNFYEDWNIKDLIIPE